MKKSKVILAIVLAVILLVICVNAPTFSWFTRPYPTTDADYTGNALALLTKNVYTAYNGNGVSMTTTACTTGAAADYASVTTAAGLGGSIGTSDSNSRKYYCTTITNTGNNSTDQNVSLYAHALHSNTIQFALGVNSPTRTYHNFEYIGTATPTTATSDMMRVYFRRPSDSYWHNQNIDVYVTPQFDGADYHSMASIDSVLHNGDWDNWFVDIPKTSTNIHFKIAGYADTGKNKTQDVLLTSSGHQTSQDQAHIYVAGDYGNWDNVNIESYAPPINGPNIYEWYSAITIDPGAKYYATPIHSTGDLTYSSSDTSVFTVDSNGKITAVGSSGTSATLTITATGSTYHDTMTKTTTITVQNNANGYDYTDEPIVKNIYVPAHAGRGNDGDPAAVKVYWYIKNNSNSSMTYTIDRIYLGM